MNEFYSRKLNERTSRFSTVRFVDLGSDGRVCCWSLAVIVSNQHQQHRRPFAFLYNTHQISIMKLTTASLLALSAAAVNARFVEKHEKDQVFLNGYTTDNEKYLLELSPGKTQWATEEEKWELRRVNLPVSIFR